MRKILARHVLKSNRRNILIFKSSPSIKRRRVHLEMLKMSKNYDLSMKRRKSGEKVHFLFFFFFPLSRFTFRYFSPLTYVSSFHVSILYLFEIYPPSRKSMTSPNSSPPLGKRKGLFLEIGQESRRLHLVNPTTERRISSSKG